jgi:PAS domain S-box-containing protein
MKPKFEGRIITGGFALALAILLVVTGLSFRNTRRLTEARELVAHTASVIVKLEQILTRLDEVETANRGYVITGQEAYLEPYTVALTHTGQDFKELKLLTADNPSQAGRVAELERQAGRRLATAAEAIRQRRVGGFEAGRAFILLGNGKREMDAIRSLIAEMETAESELLPDRVVEATAETTRTIITYSAGLVLSLSLLLVVFYLLKHQLAERRRSEQLLIEQKQDLASSAQALSEQTSLLRLVLESIGDGVVVSDENGKFLVFNPAAERILQVGPTDEGIDQWTQTYGIYLPDKVTPYPPHELPLARAIRGESVDAAELFMRHAKAPRGAWLTVTATPIKSPEGLSRGGVAIFSDSTERKRAGQALLERTVQLGNANAQLEAANTELEAFAYSVSHDLRAPLRHLAGYSQMLQKNSGSKLDESGSRYLEVILAAAGRMGDLIDNLLAFSRLGRADMRKLKVDPNQMLQNVIADLEDEARGRNIQWSIGELPGVNADPALLQMVFTNLLSNALKFTRNRQQSEIEVGCNQNNGELVVFVRDNGAGFDMKYADKLFGVFQRLHRADEFEGTGIGLANVRRIITRHGGKTWAESSNGDGATFYFSLPFTEERIQV